MPTGLHYLHSNVVVDISINHIIYLHLWHLICWWLFNCIFISMYFVFVDMLFRGLFTAFTMVIFFQLHEFAFLYIVLGTSPLVFCSQFCLDPAVSNCFIYFLIIDSALQLFLAFLLHYFSPSSLVSYSIFIFSIDPTTLFYSQFSQCLFIFCPLSKFLTW